ncbi:hypothetical protein [Amedibacillus sp. YH-ame10]
MFRDNRDDIDNNEDVDLTGMIHQYNEDNELRRKINEMKKQKEEGVKREPTFDPNDSAFINIPKEKQSSIPDIRVDHEFEKTRVNFNDGSDKTLVIMDRKNKVEPNSQPMFEDYPYQETKTSSSALRQEEYEEEEDIRETIKKKKIESKRVEDDEEDDEKSKKVNKMITYTIIGVLSVVLLVGAGFGIKYMFFNGSSDEPTEEPTKKEDPKDTEKDPVKKPSENETDIKDNSAVIKQLNSQIDAYEVQLKQVNDDIASAESAKTAAQEKLNNIATLLSNVSSIEGNMKGIGDSEAVVKKAAEDTCKIDENAQTCKDAKALYDEYLKLQSQYTLAKQQYETESKKDATYRTEMTDADTKINTLKTKKTDLEKKIAEKTTELAKYE